jgi:hypothetical protein
MHKHALPATGARAEVAEIQHILAVNVKRHRRALGLTVKAASERAQLHWRPLAEVVAVAHRTGPARAGSNRSSHL